MKEDKKVMSKEADSKEQLVIVLFTTRTTVYEIQLIFGKFKRNKRHF